jgi:hypothetical protein
LEPEKAQDADATWLKNALEASGLEKASYRHHSHASQGAPNLILPCLFPACAAVVLQLFITPKASSINKLGVRRCYHMSQKATQTLCEDTPPSLSSSSLVYKLVTIIKQPVRLNFSDNSHADDIVN